MCLCNQDVAKTLKWLSQPLRDKRNGKSVALLGTARGYPEASAKLTSLEEWEA
jgi:hypothetical protein